MTKAKATELTYSLGTTARLTGLSPEVLRAWERRYGCVEPVRTPGGTRRYNARDLERLKLLKQAVDEGHRIGRVAKLGDDDLKALCESAETTSDQISMMPVLDALDRLDGAEAQKILSLHFAVLGPRRFARDVGLPLIGEIGDRWATERMSIASEHLATALLRSILGAGLQSLSVSGQGPRLVFATPSGERHELGLLMAALVALGAGADVLYLGPDLPAEELLMAVERSDARVLALGLVANSRADTRRAIAAIRGGLPATVGLWVGGSGAGEVADIEEIEVLTSMEELDQRISLLTVGGA